MKKNKMMRTAAVLGVAALLTTSALSGTLAKYTTEVSSEDSARVATWGFTQSSIELNNLFATSYMTGDATNVKSNNTEDIIAPGTEGSTTFSFVYNGETDKPEVAYKFSVSTNSSEIDPFIKANENIVWCLDETSQGSNNDWSDWNTFIGKIKKLSGDDSGEKSYKPGNLPNEFATKGADKNSHKISWKWKFDESSTTNYWVKVSEGSIDIKTSEPSESAGYTRMTQDQYDSYMGNMAELDDVKLKITITATQID